MTGDATPGAAPAYRIDGRPVGAAAFYAAACDPRRSVVVEACAGAGKTWMLVSRLLRALLAGVPPQQLLAITFTRKAAGEMRERLAGWLAAYAEGACDPATRVQALVDRGMSAADAEAAAPALAALHERLLAGGRAVEVHTFHGWFAQLLAQAPLALLQRLGLPAAYEVVEDNAALLPATLRAFHRTVDRDEALRADYVQLVQRHRRAMVLQWLGAAFARAAEIGRADAAGNVGGAVPPAGARWAQCAGLHDPAELLLRASWPERLQRLASELAARNKTLSNTAAAGLAAALECSAAADRFAACWKALFTDEGRPRKQLGEIALLAELQGDLAELQRMRQQQQAHDDHETMLRLSRVLLREYAALKRRRGLVDMADLETAAEALLGDSELAGWVQQRLDQRVRQLLVDEFQDTSPLQWQALHGWLSSYAGTGGGGDAPAVFVVGDPKQSIYRFRNAEPRVFAAARDFVVAGLAGSALACDHTRRNAPAVVEVLNAVFGDALRLDGWGPFRDHTTGSAAKGTVRALPSAPRPEKPARDVAEGWRDSLTEPRAEPEQRLRAAEAAQAARACAALVAREGLQPGEIMVLSRKRATLALVAQALAAVGLPHAVAEPLRLHETPAALDLVAVLDALASPGHDLALARALKSPLFGAGDDDLLWLAGAAQAARTPWLPTLLLHAARLPGAALARAQGLLRGWARAAPQLPPHDLLDRVVSEGDFTARLAAALPPAQRAAALQAVDALLAASLAQQAGRLPSLYGFVRQVRAGRLPAAASAPAQAVQLLTVHGAKGLEARAVLIVDTDPEPRQPERATVLVDWPAERAAPALVAFVRSESALPASLQDAWALEDAARQREELNALYVAMTRAREWLLVSRTEPRFPAPVRAWWPRVAPWAAPWVPPAAPAATAAPPARVPVLPALTWRPAAPAGPSTTDAAAARVGQAAHRVLEWLGRPGAARDDDAIDAAAAAASVAFAAGDAARVATVARRVLNSPACARFFGGPGLAWAGNEVSVAEGGDALRIDRLVALRHGAGLQWWVLDYKLNLHPSALPAYYLQLQRYVAAVQALQPGDAVHGGFIAGDGEFVELPAQGVLL